MSVVKLVVRWWASFLGAFVLVGAAAAQSGYGADDQILSAYYGTAERHADVTERLRELARENRGFQVSNDTFGTDPHEGRVKVLRIHVRTANGSTRYLDYTEGSYVDGSRFAGWGGGNWGQGAGRGGWENPGGGYGGGKPYENPRGGMGYPPGGAEYRILNARYGTAQRNIDVTERLRELARADTSFQVSNDTFGSDPDGGRVKTLRIYAQAPGGGTRTFEYREGSVVDGSQFSGWSGGNWGQAGGGWGGAGPRSLEISRAVYGAGSRSMDVTDRLRSQVRNDRIDVTVGNREMGGDPASGRPKSLTIWYSVGGRGERQLRVNEGDRLRLP